MENQFPTCSLDDLFDNSKDLLILSGGIDSLFNNLQLGDNTIKKKLVRY